MRDLEVNDLVQENCSFFAASLTKAIFFLDFYLFIHLLPHIVLRIVVHIVHVL